MRCSGESSETVRLPPSPEARYRDNGEASNVQATNFERITVNPNQMNGVPCIRGRIPLATVLRMLAAGMSEQEILAEYPDLQPEDIRECLRFAAVSAMERELAPPRSA